MSPLALASSSASIPAYAIIPAAGAGQRCGGGPSKLLRPLAGRPVIAHTLAAVAAAAVFQRVFIAVRAAEAAEFKQALESFGDLVQFVGGGATRCESVRQALAELQRQGVAAEGIVVVHDGARCLAHLELFQRAVTAAHQWGAVTAAWPVVDSLKKVAADGQVQASLEREGVWAVQTPQAFRFDWLWEAHQDAESLASDDSVLVERRHPVRVIPGEYWNIKITTPPDFALAELYCRQGSLTAADPV